MKSTRKLFASVLFVATALSALAAPPSKRVFPALRNTAEFESLKAGDKIALVCKECDSITVQTIASTEEAMQLCKEGETVVCGSCETKAKVVRHGPRGQSGGRIARCAMSTRRARTACSSSSSRTERKETSRSGRSNAGRI